MDGDCYRRDAAVGLGLEAALSRVYGPTSERCAAAVLSYSANAAV